jgi:hypothetical protein
MGLLEDIKKEADYVRAVKLGYYPDIMHPKSFNEHILYNKFFNRNLLLAVTTDKFAVNDYIKVAGYEDILIPNYYVTKNPEQIQFDKLPGKYIVKPNHLSGSILYVQNGNISKEKIIEKCRIWLNEKHYGKSQFIWCTSLITPKIIVQEVIGDNPLDYKFHMINNKCAFISVHSSEAIGKYPKKNISYDPDWNILPFTFQQALGKPVPRPRNLDMMIEISERLSRPFNYVRVDLYNIDGRIYFGELTHFPNSGAGRFTPEKYDYEFGKLFNK